MYLISLLLVHEMRFKVGAAGVGKGRTGVRGTCRCGGRGLRAGSPPLLGVLPDMGLLPVGRLFPHGPLVCKVGGFPSGHLSAPPDVTGCRGGTLLSFPLLRLLLLPRSPE